MALRSAFLSSIGAAAAVLLLWEIRPAGAELCPELDGDALRAMAGWQVPGVALGAVRDGRVVLRRTYGVRDTATGAPVTPGTLFAVGSIAKSLTALAVAIAAEERLLALDDEVRAFIPAFPEKVTLRHLLSHTAGWPRHDALWYLDAYGRRELPDRLARLPRFAAPGIVFQYNNVPFAAAGVALEQVTGLSWDDWARRKILDPAGMTDAVTMVSGFRNAPDRASPYFPGDNGRIAVPLRDSDPVAPAAGLYAHLDDMLRYVSLLAGDGAGKVPAAAVRAIRTPSAARYGLGLNLSTWQGQEMAYHPGVIDGYSARLTLLPTQKVGIVAMTNLSGSTPAARILSQTVADCLLGEPYGNWVTRFGERRAAPGPKPAPPQPADTDRALAAYAGEFAHPAYGSFTLAAGEDGRTLRGRFHDRHFTLAYDGGDRWRLTETAWPLREGLIFAFADLRDGHFRTFASPLADGPTYRHNAGPLVFSRSPLL